MYPRDDSQQPFPIVRFVATLIAGLLLIWILYSVRKVLLVLYIAALLAIGLSPIVKNIERMRGRRKGRRRLPRWVAILVIYLGAIGAIVVAFSIILPPLVTQATALWNNLPDLLQRGQGLLRRWKLARGEWNWADFLKTLPSPELAITSIFSALQSIAGVVGALLTVFVLPYYMLIEADDLQRTFLKLFAPHRRAQVARITAAVTEKVGAWLGGQLLLASVIGATAALGLWLLGVPYFWVLAMVAAIGEMIPVVGPILAAIPAVLVGFTVSVQTGLFVALYFVVQQFVENQFLVPRIMQRQVGLSAVAVMAALLIGTELLGLVGALLAVPSAAIIQVLFQEFVDHEGAA